MRTVMIVFAVVLLMAPIATSAKSSEQTAVMATVHQFVDGLNKGDTQAAVAACASPSSIVDEFPPYHWQGATACADWTNDFAADSTKNGITDSRVALGKPKHVDISADRAYVVVPASYTYKQKGKRLTESGSMLTVALQKVAEGWRMTGWAWSKR